MKYFLIMNPGSRSGKSKDSFEKILAYFSGNKMNYDFEYTKNIEHARELSLAANSKGYDVIVAVGGDGTVNRVVNGFYNEHGKLIGKAKLGIIHTGTSPDICKSYNVPLDLIEALDALKNGFSREISIGKIIFPDEIRYFIGSANIGVGPFIAEGANTGIRQVLGDNLGTFCSMVKALIMYKPLDIVLNGQKCRKVCNITVGKTFYIASGLKIKNDLKIPDDRFFVLRVQKNILRTIYSLYKGKTVELEYFRDVDLDGTSLVEFDGDIGGKLPCRISSAENLELVYERAKSDS